MHEISVSSLVLCIESIADSMGELQQAIDDGDTVPEDYQRVDDLKEVARELEREYDKAAQTVLNLLPYDELVAR